MLQVALFQAENNGKKFICSSDVPDYITGNPNLSEDEQILFQILKERIRLPSAELYGVYLKRAKRPKSMRSFRDYMSKLETKGWSEQ